MRACIFPVIAWWSTLRLPLSAKRASVRPPHRTHRPQFGIYLARKTKEGKPPRLALNNVENKLIRIMCAVLQSKTAFIEDYHSVQPLAFQKNLDSLTVFAMT